MVSSTSATMDFFQVRDAQFPVLDSPSRTFERDVKNLVRHSRLLFSVFRPFRTEERLDELYMHRPTVGSLIYLVITSAFFAVFMLSTFLLAFALAQIGSMLSRVYGFVFWHHVQGNAFQVYPETLQNPHDCFDPCQRWVFINGIATTKTLMAQECEYLYSKFHNPILGINNRTYGFIGDIVECVVQRSLNYHTRETRLAYQVIKSYLLQDTALVNKVILIAHSQGGIIASHVLDSLLLDPDISPAHLGKLEIYTFGSAALTMNNPFADDSRTKRMIGVIEHYCNEYDMVTSWGALSSSVAGNRSEQTHEDEAKETDSLHHQPDQHTHSLQAKNSSFYPFMGNVFIRRGQTGHLLDQHYLRAMFESESAYDSDLPRPVGCEISPCYLDCTVRKLDECTNHWISAVSLLDGDARFEVLSRKADLSKGEKRVRDVSQLWKYLDT